MSKQQTGDTQTIIKVTSVASLFRRAKIVFASSLVLGVLILLFLVYIPFSSVLEESLITNFEQVATANYKVLEESIQRSIEGAKSLSSRTMIKNAAENFQKGLMTFEELADYTQPKYEDGAEALEHLASAERFIGNHRVAGYQPNSHLSDVTIPEDFYAAEGSSLSKLYLSDKDILYLSRSPVLGQNGEVAYDILIFDLTSIVQQLSTPTLHTQVVDESAYQQFTGPGQLIKTEGKTEIFSTRDAFLVSFRMQDDTFFITQESRSRLLEPIHKLRTITFSVSISLLISFISVVYFYLVRYAKNELIRLESRQDVLKEIADKANYDFLTSAGSRLSGDRSLKQAFQRFKNEGVSSTLMMLDVDTLKNINDSYGHDIGDAVLGGVTSAINQVIRDNDQLFRWGGDEFIALFSEISQDEVTYLAERILSAISALQVDSGVDGQFITPTSSIGLTVFLASDTRYEDAVKRADRALYQSKMMGRNQVSALW